MLKPTLAALLMLTLTPVAQADAWNDARSDRERQKQEEPGPRSREPMSRDARDPRAPRDARESRYGRGFEERRRESQDERRERN